MDNINNELEKDGFLTRLLEKEKQYREDLKTFQDYHIRDGIEKCKMLLNLIEYVKTGKEDHHGL